ncbi:MAG TPA: helix-turn-helix transcriptional regulator [Kofleriaceae bacterium]|nr:helix-turn-helix transcriptional regulator [Kofleriaceae bacterium]
MAAWLTAGRMARGLTREHVARVTRIQLRTLERLEEGRFDELPADVFVRGFIRNYARCVGLSVDEALSRYGACGFAAAPVASAQAHALLDAMAPLCGPRKDSPGMRATTSSVVLVPPSRAAMGTEPVVLRVSAPPPPAVEAAPPVAETASASGTKLRRVRDSKGRFLRKSEISAQIEAVSVDAIADDELEVEITVDEYVAAVNELLAEALPEAFAPAPATDAITEAKAIAPALPVVESIPVLRDRLRDRRPVVTVRTSAAHSIPTIPVSIPVLAIDDDDPEAAEREREERAKREKDGGWRSFLPPALLDQDKGRQGGLTLAVIILLIVATLTLSYLMRRPSSTGEGVTVVPSAPSATLLG